MNKFIFKPIPRSVLSLALVFILIFSTSAPALADDYNFDFNFNIDFNYDFNFDFNFDFSGLDGLSGGTNTSSSSTGTTDSNSLYWSEYDLTYLDSSQAAIVENAKKDYAAAQAAGDTAGMDAAHATAEAVRVGSSGSYSGGSDGSEYIPIGGGSSGGNVYPPSSTYYTLTATAGTGGTISPSGSTSVVSGGSQTYSIAVATGYKISSVAIDGVSVGVVSTYTFSSVTSAHTISATFASDATLSGGTITLGDGGSGTISAITGGYQMKSGYGFTANASVSSQYVSDLTVTASYKFTKTGTTSLQLVSGTWQFPVNSSSTTKARRVYVPVETKDGTYAITFTIKALDPQATALTGSNVYLTDTKTVTLVIKGSMYEDDFTGDS